MTEVNTKYSTGDEVYYISNNSVSKQKVRGVTISVTATETEINYYLNNDQERPENKLFKTKKELLDTL